MTRILHLITGPDGLGLPPEALRDLTALPGLAGPESTGLQLAASSWMIPAPALPGHEDLRLREGEAARRLDCMATLLLRDHGSRSQPALLVPSLTADSLNETSETLIPWSEVLEGLQDAFRAAGQDLHLRVWLLQATEARPATAALADLVAALQAQGLTAAPGAILQPEGDSDLAQHLRAAVQVNALTAQIAAQARATGLTLVSAAALRALAVEQLARLAAAGLAPDPARPEALEQLAAGALRGLVQDASFLKAS